MDSKQQTIIKFEDIREKIIIELANRADKMGLSEPVTLVDGFISPPFTKQLSSTFVIGSPTVPMIMLLGDNTGRIYFFAVKAILKDIGL